MLRNIEGARLCSLQVWFQRAVEAKHENLRKWVDNMAAKGHGSTWAFSHDSIDSMQRVSRYYPAPSGQLIYLPGHFWSLPCALVK